MNWIYFLIGAIIPLPVFFDVISRSILIKSGWPISYTLAFGVPIPLGTFAILILGMLTFFLPKCNTKLSASNKKHALLAIVFACLFVVVASSSLNVMRTASLVFPFVALYFAFRYTECENLLRYSLKGYAVSMVAMVVFHALSIIIYRAMGYDNNFYLFTSFFNYVIYQALISYSAVLSFLGCSLVIFSGYVRKTSLKFSLLLTSFIIFYVLGFGSRKAVLLDISICMFACIALAIYKLGGTMKLSRSILLSFSFFSFLIFYLLSFTGFAERSITIEVALEQRGGAYELFWNSFKNSSFIELLFGNGGGWGGFSNLLVEMIFRLGLLGASTFFISGVFFSTFVGSYLQRRFVKRNRRGEIETQVIVWFIFLILSVIFSNIINMNLQLPYYVINIAFISLSFLYWTNKFAQTPAVPGRKSLKALSNLESQQKKFTKDRFIRH